MRRSTIVRTAYEFFHNTVGTTVDATVANARALRRDSDSMNGIFRTVYNKLAQADGDHWRRYWERRVSQNGLDPAALEASLRRIPFAVSQVDRWELLKLHLKAHPTSRRLRFHQDVDENQPCYLRGAGSDCVRHLFGRCGVVGRIRSTLDLRFSNASGRGFEQHCLIGVEDASETAIVLRFNTTVLRVRSLCAKAAFNNQQVLVRHACFLFSSPALRGGKPTLSRAQRRQARMAPPAERPGFCLYRCDGAARGQGTRATCCGAAWGAVFFGLQSMGRENVPELEAWGFLGRDLSNNIAEYRGLLACLDHALQTGCTAICVQTDSMLIAKQVNCTWACRSDALRPLLAMAWQRISVLRSKHVQLIVEHIYRNFNKTADALANHAIDTGTSSEWNGASVSRSDGARSERRMRVGQ